MNRNLDKLHPYPFERMNSLLSGLEPSPDADLIAWSIGEPKHAAPDFLVDLLNDPDFIRRGYSAYPPTKGLPELRASISDFLHRRYSLSQRPDPETQVLPVNGTREALFAFAHAVITPSEDGLCLMPNPFYQIYEGAALLAGSTPHYLNATDTGLPEFDDVSESVWQRCQLLYLCSPGNPTGSVIDIKQLQELIRLSDEFNFVIASDECYSEIYQQEDKPPPGILEAADSMGRTDFRNCIAFNSLSKRSNIPGVRSGLVAGDAAILEKFLLYRTYHGAAMPVHHQLISQRAWQDEDHVIRNREIYRSKFNAVSQILSNVWPHEIPDAAFYLWPRTPIDDQLFTQRLFTETAIKVLPGSFLSRHTENGSPGQNRVRIALVATEDECTEAASRIVDAWDRLSC